MFRFRICLIILPSFLPVGTSAAVVQPFELCVDTNSFMQTWFHHGEVARHDVGADPELPVKVDKPSPQKPWIMKDQESAQKVGEPGKVSDSARPQKAQKAEKNPQLTSNSPGLNKAETVPERPQKVGKPGKLPKTKVNSLGVSTAAMGEDEASCVDGDRFPCESIVQLCDSSTYVHIRDNCRKSCGLCVTPEAAEAPSFGNMAESSAPASSEFGDATTEGKGSGFSQDSSNDPTAVTDSPDGKTMDSPVVTPYLPAKTEDSFNNTATKNPVDGLVIPCEDNLMMPCRLLVPKCNNAEDSEKIRTVCPMSCGLCPDSPTLDSPAMPVKVKKSSNNMATTGNSTGVTTAATAPIENSPEVSKAAAPKSETCMDVVEGINMDNVMVQCGDLVPFCHANTSVARIIQRNCPKSCGTCPENLVPPATTAMENTMGSPLQDKSTPFESGEPAESKRTTKELVSDIVSSPAATVTKKSNGEVVVVVPKSVERPLRVGNATDSKEKASQWSKAFGNARSMASQPCMDAVGGVKLTNTYLECAKVADTCHTSSFLAPKIREACPKTCGMCDENSSLPANPPGVNAAATGNSIAHSLQKFDINNDGFITENELELILSSTHMMERWSHDDIVAIVNLADKNKDDQLEVAELDIWMNAD